MVSSFYKGKQDKSSQNITDFYNAVSRVEEIYKTTKFYRELGMEDKADKLIEDNLVLFDSRKDLTSVGVILVK